MRRRIVGYRKTDPCLRQRLVVVLSIIVCCALSADRQTDRQTDNTTVVAGVGVQQIGKRNRFSVLICDGGRQR